MSIITEDYYLCEGIYLKANEKKLIDEKKSNIQLDITKTEDKITIFEREVKEWIIHPINILIKDDIKKIRTIKNSSKNKIKIVHYKYKPFKNAIAILFNIFAYIEKMQRYYDGKPFINGDKNSTVLLVEGLKRIFNNLQNVSDSDLKEILKKTRHSMMHYGMIGDGVLLNYLHKDFDEAIKYDSTTKNIKISPYHLYHSISKDFESYIKLLKTPTETTRLNNFRIVFEKIYEDEITHLA